MSRDVRALIRRDTAGSARVTSLKSCKYRALSTSSSNPGMETMNPGFADGAPGGMVSQYGRILCAAVPGWADSRPGGRGRPAPVNAADGLMSSAARHFNGAVLAPELVRPMMEPRLAGPPQERPAGIAS